MKTGTLLLLALALTLDALMGSSVLRAAGGNASEQAAAPLYLTVVGPESLGTADKNNIGRGRYDFGQVSQGKTFPIRHNFLLRNDNKTPLTLIELKTSCGCTRAEISEAVAGNPVVIAPGEQIQVLVSVDPQRLHPGSVTHTVTAMVKEQATPVALLEMKGSMMTPSITFTPSTLDFGNHRADAQPSLSLTALVEGDFWSDFHLFSSNPDIIVGEPVISATGSGQRKVSYIVKVNAHARPGPLNGVLYLHSLNSAAPSSQVLVQGNVSD